MANKEDAQDLLAELLEEGLIIKCVPVGGPAGNVVHFEPDPTLEWSDEAPYAWIYEGSQWKTVLSALGFLVAAFTLVMFPLWPDTLRSGAWYLGMAVVGFIIFIIVLAIVRLILFAITAIALKPGIWLFPNLFEDVGFFESFVPLWAWHQAPAKALKKE